MEFPKFPSTGRLVHWAENRANFTGGTLFATALGLTASAPARRRKITVPPECPYRRLYFAGWRWGVDHSWGGTITFRYRGTVTGSWDWAWLKSASSGEWSGIPDTAALSITGIPSYSKHGFSPFHVQLEASSGSTFVAGSAGPVLAANAVVLQRQSMTDANVIGAYRFATTIFPIELTIVADEIEAAITDHSCSTPSSGTEVAGELFLGCFSQRNK